MPVEIAVGPPLLSINHGATFMVTDLGGEIEADSEQGVFADDTRFVSYYAIFANGVPWQQLNSVATSYYAARVNLTNAAMATEAGDVPAGGTWHTCAHYLLVRDEAMLRPRRACYHEGADTEQDHSRQPGTVRRNFESGARG